MKNIDDKYLKLIKYDTVERKSNVQQKEQFYKLVIDLTFLSGYSLRGSEEY